MIVSSSRPLTKIHSCLIFAPVFDNGYLCGQVEESQRVMESLMMPMVGQSCATESRLRIVEAHDTVVERVFAVEYPDGLGKVLCQKVLVC